MTNWHLSIYCAFALVAFSVAEQLNADPLKATEQSSLPGPSKKIHKRFATQEFTLYLTPNEIKTLRDAKNSAFSQIQVQSIKETQQSSFQNFNEQLKTYDENNKMMSPNEPKAELRGLLSPNSFYPKDKSIDNQQNNYDFFNFYSQQKPKEEQRQIYYSDLIKNKAQGNFRNQKERKVESQQESMIQADSDWKPFNPELANKERAILHDRLKHQWNNELDNNRIQLKALSTIINNNQNIKEASTAGNEADPIQSNYKNEQKSEIEKQIEAILRDHQVFEDERQSAFEQSEPINQRPPVIIHKEVSVTKHLPIPVVKHVKVHVPTPVLVPVPEPYEVKVPHPYPVPLEIVKHIPVPVVKHY